MDDEFDTELGKRRTEVLEYIDAHSSRLARHGIHPGGFALPLRPQLLTAGRLRHLQHTIEVFWHALQRVFFVEFGGDVRRIGRLLKLDEPVMECLERYFVPERTVGELFGRSDGFAFGDRVMFIEQNITSGPGGIPGVDALSRFFDAFPPMVALRERVAVKALCPIDAYVELFSSPRNAGVTVGYLDALMPDGSLWDDDGLRFLDALAERGIELINLTGQEFELRDDGLYAGGHRIDRVYRGVAALGLWHRMDELAPVFEACGRGLTSMTITPYEMIFFDKLLMVYLSDAALSPWLSRSERRLLSTVVPWTRFLRDDLYSLCLDRKDTLVIKRGNGFGSEAVAVGAECDDVNWRRQVETALADGNWVVQELVDPPPVRLPYLLDGDIQWAEAVAMTCPYVVEGRIRGIGGRTSVPGGGRILVGAGAEGSTAGIRTAFRVG